jgi:uncharacterized protein (DUF1778 family)
MNDRRKGERIYIRVTAAQKDAWGRAAELAGMDRADWCRRGLQATLEGADIHAPALAALQRERRRLRAALAKVYKRARKAAALALTNDPRQSRPLEWLALCDDCERAVPELETLR